MTSRLPAAACGQCACEVTFPPAHTHPQIQEESNRAAASFDKASSQYAAAKEMIKVAEVELEKMISARTQLPRDATEPSQSSTTANDASLNHAWQEMLNHATIKVCPLSSPPAEDVLIVLCCRWWRRSRRRGPVRWSIARCSTDVPPYWWSTALSRGSSAHTLSSLGRTMRSAGRAVSG